MRCDKLWSLVPQSDGAGVVCGFGQQEASQVFRTKTLQLCCRETENAKRGSA
jgi:hypothetical protein